MTCKQADTQTDGQRDEPTQGRMYGKDRKANRRHTNENLQHKINIADFYVYQFIIDNKNKTGDTNNTLTGNKNT